MGQHTKGKRPLHIGSSAAKKKIAEKALKTRDGKRLKRKYIRAGNTNQGSEVRQIVKYKSCDIITEKAKGTLQCSLFGPCLKSYFSYYSRLFQKDKHCLGMLKFVFN